MGATWCRDADPPKETSAPKKEAGSPLLSRVRYYGPDLAAHCQDIDALYTRVFGGALFTWSTLPDCPPEWRSLPRGVAAYEVLPECPPRLVGFIARDLYSVPPALPAAKILAMAIDPLWKDTELGTAMMCQLEQQLPPGTILGVYAREGEDGLHDFYLSQGFRARDSHFSSMLEKVVAAAPASAGWQRVWSRSS